MTKNIRQNRTVPNVSKRGKSCYTTITFNPALDYAIKVQNLKTGKINKSPKKNTSTPKGKE